MGLLRPIQAFALGIVLLNSPAFAQTQGKPFADFVARALTGTVLPDHARFEAAAGRLGGSVESLCKAGAATSLEAVREDFTSIVMAWSSIEMYRFGPARQNNLYERLFFWPDSRSRGLRQVQRVLAEEDQTAVSPDTLRQKSVALQGLLAMEYVLFGEGAETLAAPSETFRCSYAEALAIVIEGHARDLKAGWQDYAELMMAAGKTDAVYRSHGEVVQVFLKAGAEQLQIIRDLKLARVMTEEGQAWYPRRAVFHRSDLVLNNILGNVEGTGSLVSEEALNALLTDEDKLLTRQWTFELQQIRRVLEALKTTDQAWADMTATPESQARLRYILQPLTGAHALAAEGIPQALGLIIGFNSLDGD